MICMLKGGKNAKEVVDLFGSVIGNSWLVVYFLVRQENGQGKQ